MDWYIEVWRKFAVFGGRARRKEYWYFVLFNVIASILLAMIDSTIGTYNIDRGIGLLGSIYGLAAFIPTWAVTFRRLHDTERSAWWLLILLIPLIGLLVILFFLVQEGTPDRNEFGEDPKENEFQAMD